MKSLKTFKVAFWVVISLNVMMALASVGIFMRMSPAIEKIIQRNEKTLEACEQMLMSVSLFDAESEKDELQADFMSALASAENNVTEQGETQAINRIKLYQKRAFEGDSVDRVRLVAAVTDLSKINRRAMAHADLQAKQIGSAGAWGIVFMGTAIFLVSMISLRFFNRNISDFMNELTAVLKANNSGNKFRRCNGSVSKDGAEIFSDLNKVLDRVSGE